jgi:hypothetical protein
MSTDAPAYSMSLESVLRLLRALQATSPATQTRALELITALEHAGSMKAQAPLLQQLITLLLPNVRHTVSPPIGYVECSGIVN